MNQINNTELQSALHALGQSFSDYKDNAEKQFESLNSKVEIKSLKDEKTKEEEMDKTPQTWDENAEKASSKGLASYFCSGNTNKLECKDAGSYALSTEGGYVCLPNANKMIVGNTDYHSPIRSLSNIITVESGSSYELLLMNPTNVSISDANTEFDNANSTALSMENKTVNLHALESCLNISHEWVWQTKPANFNEFIMAKIAHDISKKERDLFVSGYNDHIDSIIPTDDKYLEKGKLDYDKIIELISKLPDELHDGAVFLMTRSMYKDFLKLTDKSGKPLITVDSHSVNSFFLNYPIHFVPELQSNECQLIFCNLQKGYTIIEHNHLFNLHDQYSKKPLVQNYLRKYIGAKVVRPDAFVGFIEKA